MGFGGSRPTFTGLPAFNARRGAPAPALGGGASPLREHAYAHGPVTVLRTCHECTCSPFSS